MLPDRFVEGDLNRLLQGPDRAVVERELNRLAQGPPDYAVAERYFESLAREDRWKVLLWLNVMVGQAHPRPEEVETAIRASGLKETFTPVVMVRNRPLSQATGAFRDLPPPDDTRGLRLMLHLLAVADGRRRATDCADGCGHWWHQDLSGSRCT